MTAALLGVALTLAAPDSVEAPCPGGEVVTRAALEAAGATTLHDALRLSSVLDAVTVDGFDRQPTAPWGLPFDTPVRTLVDGAPVAAGASIEPAGLEWTPVALGEVARVVVCPGPGVAGGAFGGAWIDVQTEPPAPLAYGAVSYGNETGDPGPDRYLRDLPNVDHWGPDFEAALGVRRRTASAWAALRDRGFFPTDTALAARVFEAVDVFPARSGTVLAVAARAPGLRLRLGGVRGRDLPYVPEAGREVPVSRRSVGATASASRPFAGGVRTRGHVHAARLTLDRSPVSALALDPDWTEARVDAALSALLARPGGSAAAGASVRHTTASGPGLGDGQASVGRLWGRLERRRPGAARSLTLQASASDDGLGLGGALVGWQALGPRLAFRLTFATDHALPEAEPDAAFWVGRGYRGLDGDVAQDVLPARSTSRQLARLASTARLGRVGLTASVEGQRASGDVLLTRVERTAPTVTTARADGETVRGTLAATWSHGPVSLRATATARETASGNAAYRETWRRVPRGSASLQATLRPDTRLALWSRLAVRSATRWTGFPEADVPGAVVLDLGLSKRAWRDHLRVSLSGRNLLGAPERTHPLGAVLAPRLLVRLEARL